MCITSSGQLFVKTMFLQCNVRAYLVSENMQTHCYGTLVPSFLFPEAILFSMRHCTATESSCNILRNANRKNSTPQWALQLTLMYSLRSPVIRNNGLDCRSLHTDYYLFSASFIQHQDRLQQMLSDNEQLALRDLIWVITNTKDGFEVYSVVTKDRP